MARRPAVPAGRGIVQQLALVIAIAVHVMYFGCFSSSPSALFLAAAPAPNAAKAVMKAVAPQDDGAHAATAQTATFIRRRGVAAQPVVKKKIAQHTWNSGLYTAPNYPNYLSFFMQTRDMRFSQDYDSPYAGSQDLAKETSTHIRFDRGDWFTYDGKSKKIVTIAGESSHVTAAFAKMLQPTRSKDAFVTVLVPEGAAGNFIGSGGSKISAMGDETGALIHVQEPTPSRWRKLKVKGTNAEVNAAVSRILGEQDDDYIKETRSLLNSTHMSRMSGILEPTEIFFKLDDEQSRSVMGRGGKTARMILRDFHVNLKCDFDSSTWKISGHLGDVYAAHHYIVEKIIKQKE